LARNYGRNNRFLKEDETMIGSKLPTTEMGAIQTIKRTRKEYIKILKPNKLRIQAESKPKYMRKLLNGTASDPDNKKLL